VSLTPFSRKSGHLGTILWKNYYTEFQENPPNQDADGGTDLVSTETFSFLSHQKILITTQINSLFIYLSGDLKDIPVSPIARLQVSVGQHGPPSFERPRNGWLDLRFCVKYGLCGALLTLLCLRYHFRNTCRQSPQIYFGTGPLKCVKPFHLMPVAKTALVKDNIEKGTQSRITRQNKDMAIKFNFKRKSRMEAKNKRQALKV